MGAAARHAKTIKARADRFKNEAKNVKMAEIEKKNRQDERKIAREKRAKE